MKKSIKYLSYLLVVVTILGLTGCGSNDNKSDSSTKDVSTANYIGTYKSDDSSTIEINKDNKVNISIYRLTTFDNCDVNNIKNEVLNIDCKDPNNNTIKFSFDYKTKVLTVEDTTWSLLNAGDTFEFNK